MDKNFLWNNYLLHSQLSATWWRLCQSTASKLYAHTEPNKEIGVIGVYPEWPSYGSHSSHISVYLNQVQSG